MGIEVLDPQLKPVMVFDQDHHFVSNTISHLICGPDGRIWAATNNGLVCFTPKGRKVDTKVYDLNNGLKNEHVQAVALDRQGNVWCSTNSGIACLRKGSSRLDNYDYHDNLPAGNFNAGSVAQGPDGRLYFGSNHGLCIFNPATVLRQQPCPPVLVTSATIYRGMQADSLVLLTGRKSLNLKHGEGSFRLYFTTKNYALSQMVEYQYRLKGYNDQWMTADANGVLFSSIPAGHYTLEMRCRMHNKQWSQVSAFEVSVAPPLWLTWWAKLIYLLLVIAAGYGAFRYYMKHVRLEYLYASEKENRKREAELNKERSQFYTNIAHELRTPLTLVIGPLEELTHETGLTQKAHKRINAIYRSAQRLNELISRLLEYRKSAERARHLCVGRSNIVASLKEMFERYEELYQNAPVQINFMSNEDVVNMYFDKEVLTIIIDNLMSNAVKYTEQGSITLALQTEEAGGERLVHISVTDTGRGIPEEALPHIFERFYQPHAPNQASGTGIGLALVKSLVELHHAAIDVKSQLGQGSIFTLTLLRDATYENEEHLHEEGAPVTDHPATMPAPQKGADKPKAPATEGPKPTEGSPAPAATGDRQTLLVVEDNVEIGQYIADCLSDRFDIITANNGRAGIEAAFKHIPDLIISDVMMPYMSGIDLCKAIKADIRTSHIPVILLTAKDSMAAKQEGYEAGADSYITKPFVKSLIESRIDNLLKQRERIRNLLGNGNARQDDIEEKKHKLLDSLNQMDRDFIEQLNALIDQHVSEQDIDINFLAEHLNVSQSTLYRKMKSLTGLSTNEYLRKRKMHIAQKLLLEGRLSITEVGYEVGMNVPAYFRKCFKEEFGMTPSEYLKKVKGE